MFKSVSYTDQIRVPPSELERGAEIVAEAIDMKFVNRVLPHTGLVLGLYGVDCVREAFIHPGDGGLHAHGQYFLRPLPECVIDLLPYTHLQPHFAWSCLHLLPARC